MGSNGLEGKYRDKDKIGNLEDEIDLSAIFIILLRNSRKLALFGFLGFAISCIFAFSIKKTWQGEFQIVLEDNNPSKINNMRGLDSNLAQLISFSGGYDPGIGTQVEILKSPSVLLNIFRYVLREKGLDNNPENEIMFRDWKSFQLDIQLQKNTSILNIKYEDKSKELILPVLNKISSAYQDYSSSKRERSFDLANKYFDEQIALYKGKSQESLQKFQGFAIDNNVPINIFKNVEGDPDLSFELKRVQAVNQNRYINFQLSKINLIPEDSDKIFYFVASNPQIIQKIDLTYKALNQLMSEIPDLKTVYTEEDLLIKKKVAQKKLLLKKLKKEIINYFNSEKENNYALIDATTRSKDVIIKYLQLFKKANRDSATLTSLENQYSVLKLQQSRYKDPWKLITEPTLLPYPIKPKKKNIAFTGGIIGLLIGIGIIGISQKNKGIIYTKKALNDVIEGKFVESFSIDSLDDWAVKINPINKIFLNTLDEKVLFLCLGDLEKHNFETIKENLVKNLDISNFTFASDKDKLYDFNNLVLISYLGKTNMEQLITISNNIQMQGKSILGHLAFYDQSDLFNKLKTQYKRI